MTAHTKLSVTSVRALSEHELQSRLLLHFLVITSTRSVIPGPRKDFARRQRTRLQALKLPSSNSLLIKLGVGRAYKVCSAKRDLLKRWGWVQSFRNDNCSFKAMLTHP